MVTAAKKSRYECLKKSLICYERQTVKSRELIIIIDRANSKKINLVQNLADELKLPNVKIYPVSKHRTLGELRNIGIQKSAGKFGCIWDDDDLYSPMRLAIQLRAIQKFKVDAVAFQRHGHLFVQSKYFVFQNWRGNLGAAPQTVFFRIRSAPKYPKINKGEDTAFLFQFKKENKKLKILRNDYSLYIYCFHGDNLNSFSHHLSISKSNGVPFVDQRSYKNTLKLLGEFDFARDVRIVLGNRP